MATINDRYWESGGKTKRTFLVRFTGPDGKRHAQSYVDEGAARQFFAGVLQREPIWKAARDLAALDREFENGDRS